LRYAIFHSGNPGHLWRGEFYSLLGEAILGIGLIMWLALLEGSPKDVALALFALGLPALIAGPLAAPLTRVQEPASLLRLFGWMRVAFALGLIGMHFRTILPVVYLLLFGISLCGRLRGALRIAATRACLAPGEPERVAASTHFVAAIVAVLGPLLASLLFVLNGERILLVAAGAAVFFLLAASSDWLLDSLPRPRRAFLLARPERDPNDDPDADDDLDQEDEQGARDLDDEEDEDAGAASRSRVGAVSRRRLEAALPEWQQWGPGSFGEAVADIGAGLGLAGTSARATIALRALATLALIGGGVSIFEVFLITDHLYLPTFYLGALLAAEGAGLAVGAMLWSDLGRRGNGIAALILGLLGAGGALAALAVVHLIQWALLAAFVMGLFNAVAVEGGREALRAGFDGVERRALAAAESGVVAVCALLGTLIFVMFHSGYAVNRRGGPLVLLQAFPVAEVLLIAGIALAVAGVAFALWLPLASMRERARLRRESLKNERRGAYDDDEDAMADSGAWADSRAGGEWDDDDPDYDSRYAESVGDSRYAESYGDPRYDSRYAESVGDSRYQRGYGYDDESRAYPAARDDDPDDRAPGRGGRGRPAPRTPPGAGGRGRR
jgi:hypothetical protein